MQLLRRGQGAAWARTAEKVCFAWSQHSGGGGAWEAAAVCEAELRGRGVTKRSLVTSSSRELS